MPSNEARLGLASVDLSFLVHHLNPPPQQATALEQYIKQCSLTCVTVQKADAVKCMADPARGRADGFAEHSFDRVLLDAPCSGLGQ